MGGMDGGMGAMGGMDGGMGGAMGGMDGEKDKEKGTPVAIARTVVGVTALVPFKKQFGHIYIRMGHTWSCMVHMRQNNEYTHLYTLCDKQTFRGNCLGSVCEVRPASLNSDQPKPCEVRNLKINSPHAGSAKFEISRLIVFQYCLRSAK